MFSLRFILFPYLFLSFFCLKGQSIELLSEEAREGTFGSIGRENIVALAMGSQQNIVAVGNDQRGPDGHTDIYLLLFDERLNLQKEKHLGRSREDAAHHVCERPNGGFLISGFSTTPKKETKIAKKYAGGKDGWLLWIDDTGEAQSELLLGTEEDDEFIQATPLENGHWIIAGNSNGSAWVLRIDGQKNVIWEKRWRPIIGQGQLKAMTIVEDQIYLAGSILENNQARGWFLALSSSGEKTEEKVYESDVLTIGHHIQITDDNQLVIIGEASTRQKRNQGAFLKIDQNGQVLQTQLFGGREHDRFLGAARGFRGGWLLFGESQSFERGARQPMAWIVNLDRGGAFKKEYFFGSKFYDSIHAALQTYNGSWIVAGETSKKVINGRQAWVWQAAKTEDRLPEGLTVLPKQVVYPGGLGSRKDAEQPFLPVHLESSNQRGIPGLKIEVEHLASGKNWVYYFPARPYQKKSWIGLPIARPDIKQPGKEKFSFKCSTDLTNWGEPQYFEVQFTNKRSAKLSLRLEESSTSINLQKGGKVQLEVVNEGSVSAKGVTLYIRAPTCFSITNQIKIGDLPPDSKLQYNVSIPPQSCGTGMYNFYFRVANEDLLQTASDSISLSLLEPEEYKVESPSKEEEVFLSWITPNPDTYDHEEIVWHESEITIQLKVISSIPIKKEHICVEINGIPCEGGQKFKESKLIGKDDNSKTYFHTIQLQEGENVLRASVENAAGKMELNPITILFNPGKPNLHLLSIGIPSYDLRFTTNDARDFAQLFSVPQPGVELAYQNVFIDTLLSEAKTTKTEILKRLRRIQYRYADQQIAKNDLIVLFISSHGLSSDQGKFRIATSDFDSPFMKETSLDLEAEIVAYLEAIPCRKLFFIDACNSGAGNNKRREDQGPSTAYSLTQAAKNHLSEIDMVLSCQADEYSYEDQKWQNGAFTEAMIRTIQGGGNNWQGLDQNKDQYIDLEELFTQISIQTPKILSEKKPKTRTGQHPVFSTSSEANQIILFKIQ